MPMHQAKNPLEYTSSSMGGFKIPRLIKLQNNADRRLLLSVFPDSFMSFSVYPKLNESNLDIKHF